MPSIAQYRNRYNKKKVINVAVLLTYFATVLSSAPACRYQVDAAFLNNKTSAVRSQNDNIFVGWRHYIGTDVVYKPVCVCLCFGGRCRRVQM
jgi:hypothetical protein